MLKITMLLLAVVTPLRPGLPTVPGATNPAVTQDNIKSTICVSGWTKTIRPTAFVRRVYRFNFNT